MNKSKVLSCVLIILLLAMGVCAWIMFGGVTGISGLSYANADKYTAGGTTVTSPVENLTVNWTEGFVRIGYHSGSGIIVSETSPKQLSEDNQLRWWLDGTTLRVQYAKSGLRLSWNLQKTLTVSLPEGTVLKKADIAATSAEMTVSDLVAEEIVLGSTSGNLTASTVTQKLTAASTSGDMNIRQENVIESAVLRSTSGNIACTLDVAKTVSAESTSGSVGLTLTDCAGSVTMRSTSGNVIADLPSADTVSLHSTSGSINVSLGAFKELKADSTSGSVTAALPGEPGLTCSVHTTSGSFSSDLALAKNGSTYTCGDGSASCSITTTSGDVRILAK